MREREPRTRGKEAKRPAWTRALDVVLRTAHVAVTSVLFGGAVCGVPFDRLVTWHQLAVASGLALIVSELYHCRHWPYQGRGLMGLTHLGLLGLIPFWPELRAQVLAVVLVFGMVGSHMPKRLRYFSFLHGRVVPAP